MGLCPKPHPRRRAGGLILRPPLQKDLGVERISRVYDFAFDELASQALDIVRVLRYKAGDQLAWKL
jgi:hypothetical protein